MGQNKISNFGALQINKSLKKLKNLMSLDLDLNFNKINRECTAQIDVSDINVSKISSFTLNLNSNKIGDNGS